MLVEQALCGLQRTCRPLLGSKLWETSKLRHFYCTSNCLSYGRWCLLLGIITLEFCVYTHRVTGNGINALWISSTLMFWRLFKIMFRFKANRNSFSMLTAASTNPLSLFLTNLWCESLSLAQCPGVQWQNRYSRERLSNHPNRDWSRQLLFRKALNQVLYGAFHAVIESIVYAHCCSDSITLVSELPSIIKKISGARLQIFFHMCYEIFVSKGHIHF